MYELKDYLNAINHKKEELMAGEDVFWEKRYPAYIVNKALSAFAECVLYVNEMNRLHHLDLLFFLYVQFLHHLVCQGLVLLSHYYSHNIL